MGKIKSINRKERKPYTTGQKAFTEEECNRLLLACKEPEDRILILIGISLGPRRDDIVRIRVDNINFNENNLTYLEKKKKDKSHTVPIGPKLRQELLFYLKNHKSVYLFPNQQKSKNPHMSGRTAYNRLNELCKDIGLKSHPFHALRSTAIKLKQKEGWTVEMVAALVDDRVSTVQQHYTTPSAAELKKAMEEMEGI